MSVEPHSFKLVIFDIGSTLYQPLVDHYTMTRQLLEAHDYHGVSERAIQAAFEAADECLDRYMLTKNVDMHWRPSPEVWLEYNRYVFRRIGIEKDSDRLAAEYQQMWMSLRSDKRRMLYAGVAQTLKEIVESGHAIAIASNRFDDPTEFLLRDGISNLFSAIEYSNVPGYRKPSPLMLLIVAYRLGINPRRCVYVGNTVAEDIEAARRAEMQPVLIRWNMNEGPTHEEPTSESIPDNTIVISHIEEILHLLE